MCLLNISKHQVQTEQLLLELILKRYKIRLSRNLRHEKIGN